MKLMRCSMNGWFMKVVKYKTNLSVSWVFSLVLATQLILETLNHQNSSAIILLWEMSLCCIVFHSVGWVESILRLSWRWWWSIYWYLLDKLIYTIFIYGHLDYVDDRNFHKSLLLKNQQRTFRHHFMIIYDNIVMQDATNILSQPQNI